ALNEALRDFVGNLIFTTHDHQLTQTVANRIIEITPSGMIDSLMEFDNYLKADNIREQRAQLMGEVLA
ncbi:MAG: ABC-F family ATPase, partial [Bacteroidota bacterium]